MPVAIVASLLGLVAVLVAYYRDPPLAERHVPLPDWDLLPDPSDLARVEFPIAIPGYDPATVELHFDLLTRAYVDLLAVATPDVIARARHRAAVRRGLDPDSRPATVAPDAPQRTSLTPLVSEGPDVEALRTEAALAQLEEPSAQPQPEDGER